jgi:hypothetical protein
MVNTPGRLQITCVSDGTVFESVVGGIPGGCPAKSVDIVKSWLAIAQSALLANKLIDMDFTLTGGQSCINAVKLRNN